MSKKTKILMILDGWGKGKDYDGNAIYRASTPNFDRLITKYPSTIVKTSGNDVGLPKGQMGNSEVGHMNIGAGRIVYQQLTRITKSIETGEIEGNEELLKAFEHAVKNNTKLHLMGLLSDGGVHSHNKHLYKLIRFANSKGVKDIYVHCYMDGRDVPPTSGAGFIKELEDEMKEIGAGKIATIMGRYYAMDRDNRWERIQIAYDALTEGKGVHYADPVEGVESAYANGENDEFIKPIIVAEDGKIKNDDSVIFFNFRPDRAREITRAIVDDDFKGFDRKKINTKFVCMTQYDITIKNVSVAFKPQTLENTFGEYISRKGFKQLRIAETDKYAHVTFFFNGGVEAPNEGEERVLIPSPKVATYDLQPEMSAYEVKDALLKQLKLDIHDVVIINFANPDMVGHTGIMKAAIKAVETVDNCLGEISDYVIENDMEMLVTADHGNADEMLSYDNSILTQHSTNPVPLIYISNRKEIKLKKGRLADLAPTILELMDIEKPEEMTGESLLV
jgi:2,3-bisphosphoglycerate-independent phosphoglycerate mutase